MPMKTDVKDENALQLTMINPHKLYNVDEDGRIFSSQLTKALHDLLVMSSVDEVKGATDADYQYEKAMQATMEYGTSVTRMDVPREELMDSKRSREPFTFKTG